LKENLKDIESSKANNTQNDLEVSQLKAEKEEFAKQEKLLKDQLNELQLEH
jgi:hypothetical protein